jgi:hypothetical protein
MSRPIALYRPARPHTTFPGDARPSGLIICFGADRIYRGELIRCQSDHDEYVCSRGGVAMSGSDGTDTSTQVTVCQVRVGACGQVLSILALNGFATRGPRLSSLLTGT